MVHEEQLPPPVTVDQMYMAAILDELRAIRVQIARSPEIYSTDEIVKVTEEIPRPRRNKR